MTWSPPLPGELNLGDWRSEVPALPLGAHPVSGDGPRHRHPHDQCSSETAATKPAFRKSLRDRRCLVLADGFYDRKREGSRSQPYYITLKSGDPLAFAGPWDHWAPTDEKPLETCTILTTTPNAVLQPIHDRMPVILPLDAYNVWLDPAMRDVEPVHAFLTPYPADEMRAYPVGTRVNNPAHDAPDLTEPLAPVSRSRRRSRRRSTPMRTATTTF